MAAAARKRGLWTLVRDTFTDALFIGKVLTIALPVALQNLLNTVTNMIDTIMIGSLGASTIAAVGLANKYFFVFGLLVFGICSGSGVLSAQFYGNRDLANIRRVLGLTVIMASIGTVFFMAPGFFAPDTVMRIFTTSTDAQAIGVRYLRIVVFSYWFMAVNVAMVQMMRTVGSAQAPVFTSILAIAVNIFLNYTLIFGHFGAPRLGVEGAALATLAARVAEFIALLIVMVHIRVPHDFSEDTERTKERIENIVYIFRGRVKEFIGWNSRFLGSFFSTSVPVIFNEFMWGLGTTLYSVAYGRMGDNAVAAVTISSTIEELMMVLWFGLSAATSVILGNELGAGKLKEAEDHAAKFCVVSVVMSLAVMLLLFLIRRPITSLFAVGPEVEELVVKILNVLIIVFIPKMLNNIIVVGILRAGGDTRWCLFIDTSGVWCVGVPLAFLGALYWHLPIHIVFFLVCIEEIYKMFFGLWRVSRKKWLRNIAIEVQ